MSHHKSCKPLEVHKGIIYTGAIAAVGCLEQERLMGQISLETGFEFSFPSRQLLHQGKRVCPAI